MEEKEDSVLWKSNRSSIGVVPSLAVAALVMWASTAFAAPLVEIVVYSSGTTLPATGIAACSEPDCLGYTIPQSEWTWAVLYPKNYVAWSVANGNPKKRVYLLVDGKTVASARSGSLLVLSTGGFSTGPHVVQGMGYGMDGSPGLSTPMTICFNTPGPC
jgi:hypothetical protein